MRFSKRLAAVAIPLATAAALALPSAASAAEFPLTAWWPLAEGKGQVIKDWSGKGHHGFLGETPQADTHDPTWIRGGIFGLGSALRFDGIDDYAQVPDSPAFKTQKLTISLWFRGNGTPGSYKYLFARGGDGCTATSYGLTTHFNGGLFFYVWDGSAQHLSGNAEASIWDGKWHHAAGTWDGVNSRLFIDGVEMPGGTSYPGTIDYEAPTGNAVIGGYHAGCDLLMKGDLDQIMLWSDALPVSDIWRKFSVLFNRPRR
jgi:hypothetical protein